MAAPRRRLSSSRQKYDTGYMETIGARKLWSFVDGNDSAMSVTSAKVRSGLGHHVESFVKLATRVAELQFLNRDYVFLFRGQQADYLTTRNNTTLKPSLFRPDKGRASPDQHVLQRRFSLLDQAEVQLMAAYRSHDLMGKERIARHRVLRWAILQHYEVCPTPLLDVTQSLRIAASFGSLGASEEAYVYVIGVPNLSGAVTASAEAGMQIIRLSSVCPPSAIRPHLQEGYLLGEFPDLADYNQKACYPHYEIDMARRLVAKFRITPRDFWADGAFPQVSKSALYPGQDADQMAVLMDGLRDEL